MKLSLRLLTASLVLLAPSAWAQSVAGMWDATMDFNGTQIPFRFELAGQGATIKGWFFNGDDREISNAGSLENGKLVLNYDSYLAKLTGTFKDGAFDGEYGPMLNHSYPVHMVRAVNKLASTRQAPSISGQWDLTGVKSGKGEKAWRLILRQSGTDISGAILRVDGDTGTLSGRYEKDGQFVLSHFSGARPALMIIKPAADGTLDISLSALHGFSDMKAYRPEEAIAKGLAQPTDPNLHTSVKDATKPFAFSFPDLNGNIVSNTDARFRGKVLVINLTGSWCPNCHDEAPFLAAMYDKYRKQGLEVVALNFEEADQLKNPTRLRAFMKEYGIHYTVLLGGENGDSAKAKLPQAVNWDAWPTTFFVGRDGLVRAVHAGFPSPGSGELYRQAKDEFTSTVEKLLAENQTSAK
jgi:thiol-disulfide isomerase/thioredoxin